jgi:tripartite-type tricarboxylate transporter receptor subunit TctC
MKPILCVLLVSLLVFGMNLSVWAAKPYEGITLVVSRWAGDPFESATRVLADQFEEETGCEIIIDPRRENPGIHSGDERRTSV